MRWRIASVGFALLSKFTVSGLRATDQVRVHDFEENPRYPSQTYLRALQNPKTLIIASNNGILAQHSVLIGRLRDGGHDVKVYIVSDPSPGFLFSKDGKYLFDNVILFGNKLPLSKQNKKLNAKVLADFLDEEWLLPRNTPQNDEGSNLPHSLTIFSGECEGSLNDECELDKAIVTLAKQFGFLLNAQRRHLKIGSDSNRSISATPEGRSVLGSDSLAAKPNSNLYFNGLKHEFARSNPTIIPILECSDTDNVSWLKKQSSVGEKEALVSAWQGSRSWSRMILAGSSKLCSDEVLSLSSDQNALCNDLIDWASHRKGILTWANLSAFKIDEPKTWVADVAGPAKVDPGVTVSHFEHLKVSRPYLYKTFDEIYLGLDLYVLAQSDDAMYYWKPYTEMGSAQLEFTMMYPYMRDVMIPIGNKHYAQHNLNTWNVSPLIESLISKTYVSRETLGASNATHASHFMAPHVHGVFKAVIQSTGVPGMTPIWVETVMPLRNFKHDDYDRFLTCAMPYYAALITTLISTAVFGLILLYGTATKKAKTS